MNKNRALKDMFCLIVSVQNDKCILCEACLKTRYFTANVWRFYDFSTKLFCIFLKANIFSNTERRKMLQLILISKFEKLFQFLNSFLSSRNDISRGKYA